MSLRICLVTPFAWSQPHDVNEHAAGVAAELRRLGHEVTILAPSNRAADLLAGRRALQRGDGMPDVVAIAPAFPISRRSRMGVPVGARANLSLALALGRFDVVHGLEPGLPSLSYLALRDAQALAVATFFSPDRLSYPPGRTQRERLLSRIDALLATSDETAAAAGERFPGDYDVVSEGVDADRFRPTRKRPRIVLEWRATSLALARALMRTLTELDGWELVLVRTKPLSGRPYVPRQLRDRVTVRTARDGASRAELLAEAAIFVPAPGGLRRFALEADA
jgi:phosphatidylinositol alpha-mannosyltransferase